MFLKNSIIIVAIFCHSLLYAQKKQVDVLIKNGTVFIGDGKDSVRLNIGITGDRISYLGELEVSAKQTIDANGKYISPGFIDPHTHADRWITDRKRNEMLAWIYQGVTTVFAGNDGFGTYKIAEQFKEFEEIGMGTNFAFFVGFGPVRQAILHNNNVSPTAGQLDQMKTLVAQGMQEGAIGFSTGLLYLPQMYSKTPEVEALYKEAAKYGAVYDTHQRSEGLNIEKSIDEILKIGDGIKLPLHISHLKVSGESNWDKVDAVINKINKARAKGINITANQYPFIASMTGLKSTLIPSWAQEGGNKKTLERLGNNADLERIMEALHHRSDEGYKRIILVSKNIKTANISGKTLYDIAKMWNMSNAETAVEILKKDINASAINFTMSEENIIQIMKQPWVMTGSDGGGKHPRTYATFTKIIEDYVNKDKILSMSWAIHRASGLTAETFNLKDRGLIKEGYYADIIVFDPKNIKVNSTFEEPEQYAGGMDYVFVNGVKAIDNGKKTGKLAGKIIKKQ